MDFIDFYKKVAACDCDEVFVSSPRYYDTTLRFHFDSGHLEIPIDRLKTLSVTQNGTTISVTFDSPYTYTAKNQENANTLFAAFSDLLDFCKKHPDGISLENTMLHRLKNAGILYDGDYSENLKGWFFEYYGIFSDAGNSVYLLENLRIVSDYVPDRKILFSAHGYESPAQTESEYVKNWGGFLEYEVTYHWLVTVFMTDKNVLFFYATRTDPRYEIIHFYPCGAGGAYDPTPLKTGIKVLKLSELHDLRAIRCKEVPDPIYHFAPADDGEFVKVFCKDEEKKEDDDSEGIFSLKQKRTDYVPDEQTKAGYVPLGILRAEAWERVIEIAKRNPL